MPIDERMVQWTPIEPEEQKKKPRIDERLVRWQPIRADPSTTDVILNAANKGLAGAPDALLNAPNRLLNLGKAAIGTAATAAGRPDWAPELTPDPDYAARALRHLGAIRAGAEPTTSGARFLDSAVQGAVGGLVSPANGLRMAASNAAMGALSGGAADVVGHATGSDALAISAGMLVPAAAANARAMAQRLTPRPQIDTVLRKAIADEQPVSDIRARLQGAQELVPGSLPMSQQVADSPAIAQLARSTRNIVQGGGPITLRDQAQNAARLGALDGISSVTGTVAQAADNAGGAIYGQGRAGYDAARAATSEAYRARDPDKTARIELPARAAQNAADMYFGKGAGALPGELSSLLGDLHTLGKAGPVDLDTLGNLRSRASEAAYKMGQAGDKRAASAAGNIKRLLDEAVQGTAERVGGKYGATGEGPHGPVYGGLAGDANNAVAHLLRMRSGEVPGALRHPQINEPIDLTWGQPGTGRGDGAGLSKLEAFHPEVLQDLQGIVSSMPVLQRGANRIRLESPDHKGVVRLDWENDPKHWLLSAFEKDKASGASKRTDTAGLTGGGGKLSPATADPSILPDNYSAFKGLGVGPPLPAPAPRDPRQYSGEFLTPEMAAADRAAKAARINQADRFETGFARRLWRDGADGLPQLTGGEIPRAAFNNGATQAQEIAQWAKMGRPGEAALKNYAITSLVEAAAPNGQLNAHSAGKWTRGRSEAIKGLFSADEQSALESVVKDARRAADAEALGRAGGSNTAQNLEGGLLFSRPLDWASNVPKLGALVRLGLKPLRDMQKERMAAQMQGLLLDPQAMARALGPRAYDPFSLPAPTLGGLLGIRAALAQEAVD